MQITINDFSPVDTFECGQCFRWIKQEDSSYIGVAKNKVLKVSAKDNTVILCGCTTKEYDEFWKDYFDFDRDYEKIKQTLCINDTMKDAVSFGGGIRILRQDFFETLISFIISQRSSIPKIKSCIEKLCHSYGEKIVFEQKEYYSFPTAEMLKDVTEDDFKMLGVGYRAKYLKSAVEAVLCGKIDETALRNCDTVSARKELLKIYGVGDKVCDCILLFSLSRYDLFPSDVWIKRVMSEYFSAENAKQSGESIFGELSGFAQQYLFYWRKNLQKEGSV